MCALQTVHRLYVRSAVVWTCLRRQAERGQRARIAPRQRSRTRSRQGERLRPDAQLESSVYSDEEPQRFARIGYRFCHIYTEQAEVEATTDIALVCGWPRRGGTPSATNIHKYDALRIRSEAHASKSQSRDIEDVEGVRCKLGTQLKLPNHNPVAHHRVLGWKHTGSGALHHVAIGTAYSLTKTIPGKNTRSGDRQLSFKGKFVTAYPATRYQPAVDLRTWRNAVISAQVEENPAVVDRLRRRRRGRGRGILNSWSEYGGATGAVLVPAAQVPSSGRLPFVIPRVEGSAECEEVEHSFINCGVGAPVASFPEQTERVAFIHRRPPLDCISCCKRCLRAQCQRCADFPAMLRVVVPVVAANQERRESLLRLTGAEAARRAADEVSGGVERESGSLDGERGSDQNSQPFDSVVGLARRETRPKVYVWCVLVCDSVVCSRGVARNRIN